MLFIGVTGGIGSGKSTLVALLAERGAHVIDADLLARDALRPARPAWHSVVDQFGDEVLAPHSMEIDRGRLAEIVFSDRNKLAALNAIVHPVVFKGIADTIDMFRNSSAIVVLDAALIVETGLDKSLDVLIVVVASDEARKKRLVRSRGMTDTQISERMAAQHGLSDLLERADIVVRNDGTLDELAGEADRVWSELEARAR